MFEISQMPKATIPLATVGYGLDDNRLVALRSLQIALVLQPRPGPVAIRELRTHHHSLILARSRLPSLSLQH